MIQEVNQVKTTKGYKISDGSIYSSKELAEYYQNKIDSRSEFENLAKIESEFDSPYEEKNWFYINNRKELDLLKLHYSGDFDGGTYYGNLDDIKLPDWICIEEIVLNDDYYPDEWKVFALNDLKEEYNDFIKKFEMKG